MDQMGPTTGTSQFNSCLIQKTLGATKLNITLHHLEDMGALEQINVITTSVLAS